MKTGTPNGGIIYGNTGDKYANVVKDSSGAIMDSQGNAVCVGTAVGLSLQEIQIIKCKESTSGVTDNLSYDGTTGTATGLWDF